MFTIKQKKFSSSLNNLIKNPEAILIYVFIFHYKAVVCNNDISFRKRVKSNILFSLFLTHQIHKFPLFLLEKKK